MERTPVRVLERRNLILGGLAVLLGLWLILRPEPARGVALDALPKLLPDLDPSAVREIDIESTDPERPDSPERVRVQRRDLTSWVLPDRYDHPVLPNAAERLLDAIADARDRGTVTSRADTFERYRPSTGWKSVTLKDGAGRTLARLDLGRSDRSDLLVRLGEGAGARIARVARLRPSVAPTRMTEWIETQLWPGTLRSATLVRLDLDRTASGGKRVVAVKHGITAEGLGVASPPIDADAPERLWSLIEPSPAEADRLAIEEIGRAFTGLVVADVVAAESSAGEATFGFDKPDLVAVFHELVGDKVTAHRLVVGARAADKDAWYVRVEGRPFVYLVESGHNLSRLRSEPAEIAPALAEMPGNR